MAKADTINIAVVIDDKGSVTLRKIGDESEKAGKKGEKGMAAFRKGIADLDSSAKLTVGSLTTLAGIGFTGVLTGLGLLTVGLFKAFGAASDLEEVSSKFGVVFADQMGKAEAWATELVNGYAMSTREARQYLSSVQDLLVPMGMAADQAGVMSMGVTTLAADLGSFNNLPTVQVMDDMQSALVGNYETMKKYGIVINAASVEQKALTMGLAETKSELTAAHKAQAAYQMMVEGSSAAIGDMSRTMDGYANQSKQFSAIIEDLTAAFEQRLLPVAADVLSQINQGMRDGAGGVDSLATSLSVKLLQALGIVIETMRFFHNGWLGIKLVGTLAIDAIAQSIEFLFGGLRNLLVPLDLLFEGAKKLGAIDANPFDGIEDALGTFSASSRDVTNDVLADIDKTNAAYDKAKSVVEGYIDVVKDSAAADQAQVYLKQTADVAGLAAAEQKMQLEGVVTKHVESNAKIVKSTKDAYAEMTDSSIAYYQGLQESADRSLNEQIALETELTAKLKELTLSDLDYKKWALDEEVEAMRAAAGGQKELLDMVARYQAEKQDQMLKNTEALTMASEQLWKDFATSTGNIIEGFLQDLAHGEFDSFGDAFQGLLDSMLDMLISFVAKATAMSVIETIFNVDSGQNTLGDLISGIGDWFSGSGGQASVTGGATVTGGAMHVLVVGGTGGGLGESSGGTLETLGELWDGVSTLWDAAESLSTTFDNTPGAWDSIATDMSDAFSDKLDTLDFSATGDGFDGMTSDDFFGASDKWGADISSAMESGASDFWSSSNTDTFWASGQNLSDGYTFESYDITIPDNLFATNAQKDEAIINYLESLPSREEATITQQLASYKEVLAPYLSALSSAYGVYGGIGAIQNGNYVGGGIQTAGSLANIAQNEAIQELVPALQGMNTTIANLSSVIGVAGGAYGMYSNISDMSENGVNAGNAVGAVSSAYNTYTAGQAAYTAISDYVMSQAITEGAAVGAAAATSATVTSTATTAAAQSIIAAEGVGWGAATTTAGASTGVAGGLASTGYGMAAAIAIMIGQGIYGHMKDDKNTHYVPYQTSYGETSVKTSWGKEDDPSYVWASLLTNVNDAGIAINAVFDSQSENNLDKAPGWRDDEIDSILDSLLGDDLKAKFEVLSTQFGDAFAQIALDVEPTVESFGYFMEQATGFSISTDLAAESLAQASSAAQGDMDAFSSLTETLRNLGLSYEAASISAGALTSSLIDSSSASMEAAGSIDYLAGGFYKAGDSMGALVSGIEGIPGAVGSSVSSINAYLASLGGATPVAGNGANVNQYHANGGLVDRFADGGVLTGGSGVRDDLYLGTINGRAQIAMGGEYIMPPDTTAKYYPVLEMMRADLFGDGGVTGGADQIRIPVTSESSESGKSGDIYVEAKIFVGEHEIKNIIRKEIEISRRQQGRRDSGVDEVRLAR